MKSSPLDSEVVKARETVPNMPPVWRVRYRGIVVWERLHEPTEHEVREALRVHRDVERAKEHAPPNFNNALPKRRKYGRDGRGA